MRKNERGITLVALVVTIVVLLILAGITITYVLSDNGIFGKAQQAASDTEKAVVAEAVALAVGDLQAEIYAPTEGKTMEQVFADDLPSDITVSTPGTISGTPTDGLSISGTVVKYKNNTYTVAFAKATGLEIGEPTPVAT